MWSFQNQPRRKELLSEVASMVRRLADFIETDEAADELGSSFLYDALPPVLNKGISDVFSLSSDKMFENILWRVKMQFDSSTLFVKCCLVAAITLQKDSPLF